jgi:hypothetical protein
MFDALTAKFDKWNKYGLPLPMVRDPKISLGSITATMFWASFTMCMVAGVIFLVTALAHLTGVFIPGDATQEAIKNAASYFLELYVAAGSFYLGRKMQKNAKGEITLDAADPSKDVK